MMYILPHLLPCDVFIMAYLLRLYSIDGKWMSKSLEH